MNLHTFFSRLQELNGYTFECFPDIEGQENAPLPVDENIDLFYSFIPTMWNK